MQVAERDGIFEAVILDGHPIAVADHTKIGKTSFLRVCDLRALDTIITDKEADETFATGARKQGIEVVQV